MTSPLLTVRQHYRDLAVQAERVAHMAREIAASIEEREKDLAGFHQNSAARRAAEILLDSRAWLTRTEIAEAAGCQPNAVVAVVKRLERNGVPVYRRVVAGHAEYLAGEEQVA